MFWNQYRNNNNGRWGASEGYYFRCFIYLPDDVQRIIEGGSPEPTPTPTPSDQFNIGDHVIVNGPLYENANAAYPAGYIENRETYITRKVPGTAHPYNTTDDLGWMNEDCIVRCQEPSQNILNIGDTVRIVGTGNGSCYGDGDTAYGIGWDRQILNIWDGMPYPYQVGNNTGTTGFYQASSLQKM